MTLPRTLPALLCAALLILSAPLAAQATEVMPLSIDQGDTGPEIGGDDYVAKGNRLLLWLPGEHGISPRQRPTAKALAAAGIEVWMPDLHAAYFLPPGRNSLNEIEASVATRLIDAALASGKRVYVLAAGRSAGMALNAIRLWQGEHAASRPLMGALLLSPKLYLHTPQGGEDAKFLPVVHASNTPIYLLQPESAAGYWRLRQTMDALSTGGSPVILQRLMGVSDGFNTRLDVRPGEEKMTARLPQFLKQGMALLDSYGPVPDKPIALAGKALGAQQAKRHELLHKVADQPQAPSLALTTLDGKPLALDSLQGKVVLVNFWATWCPPCVKEVPSLERLYHELHARGFEIMAVAVGEPADKVRAFLADKPVSFPVLLDSEGAAFRDWQAYAFPTSLILDRQHRIRYAVFGAFDWASGDVLRELTPLLDERPEE
jgi:thiol-disulfide isomerase/thioredoxin